MPDMTPIRVRGKRSATDGEKWHARKQRKAARQTSLPASERDSNGQPTMSALVRAAAKRSRRRAATDLSRLEQLPTEILQSIFEYSANVDLPLASPRLASQLASGILHQQLTSQVLGEALSAETGNSPIANRRRVMRLMNSKFFTWPFFQAWLQSEFNRLDLQDKWQSWQDLHKTLDQSKADLRDVWTWTELCPSSSSSWLPPQKLLLRPFTPDKIKFLQVMTGALHGSHGTPDAVYQEVLQDGVQQAVEDGAGHAVQALLDLGASVDTELLRKAVIDAGCNNDVVEMIIRHGDFPGAAEIDFLDPALWAWADKATASGDERGQWLLALLKSSARDSGQSNMAK